MVKQIMACLQLGKISFSIFIHKMGEIYVSSEDSVE